MRGVCAGVVVRVVGSAAGREAWYTNCAKSENIWVDRCSDHDFHAVKPRCQISFQIWVDRTGKSEHLIPQKCFDQMTLAYLSPVPTVKSSRFDILQKCLDDFESGDFFWNF